MMTFGQTAELNEVYDIKLRDDEQKELKKAYSGKLNAKARDRIRCILLRNDGFTLTQLGLIFRCSLTHIKDLIKLYKSKGMKEFITFNYTGDPGNLTAAEKAMLERYIEENKPSTAKQIVEWIKDNLNKSFTPSGVTKLLKKLKFSWKKPKILPGKPPSVEAQERHLKEYNEIRMFCNMGVLIIFMDAMHLIHNPILRACWLKRGKVATIPSNTGRKRLNILGGYDINGHKLIFDADESNCDSGRIIKFFQKLEESVPSNIHSIVLILDNAAYQKHPDVMKYIENTRIILMFLPEYSPHLNLIERFWKFCKKHLVINTYIEKYKNFRAKVFQLLNNIDEHKNELKSLITENFEIIRPAA
ncbi:MAG: IS630 family transposase [Nitrospirae bacterium]|nr:IS630 family transposase [Nitrospirota bacterium]